MIKREDVYKIGLFNKPHGIHGELSFTFTDDIFDRADCDYLICRLDDIFVPFFIGEVTDVDTSTVNTLFVVDRDGDELLIPAQEELIAGIDQKHKIITVDLPEGLLSLDECDDEES